MKFRKKPVVIEAMRLPEKFEGPEYYGLIKWAVSGGANIYVDVEERFSIKTLEGDMLADRGDWIIKGVKGEFYPCKPDIFEATYEAVVDQ